MTQVKDGTVENQQSEPHNDNVKQRDRKEKSFQTKVVIRRLPPTMTLEQFLEQIDPVPENDYFYFVKGDMSMGIFAFSRAYISFVHQEDIFVFKDKFDGYVFVDGKGNEYAAVVEFAPFQKIPKKRVKKRDPKCGTIEQDPDYLKFLESTEDLVETVAPSAESYLEEIEARERELKANSGVPKITTPLIEYLKQRKMERQKMREEKREERKRRDLERKRIREEERRRKKTVKEEEEEPVEKAPVVTLLKNVDREKEKNVVAKPKWGQWDRRDRQREREKAAAARERERSRRVVKENDGSKQQEPQSSSVKGFATKGRVQDDAGKDPRLDRRIRNKDRPSLEIYRPGMRKMKSQKENSPSTSPSPHENN